MFICIATQVNNRGSEPIDGFKTRLKLDDRIRSDASYRNPMNYSVSHKGEKARLHLLQKKIEVQVKYREVRVKYK
jgi:hypothetical protein